MDIYEVVKKLVGETEPIGETREDERRLENLKNLISLAEKIHLEIARVAYRNKSDYRSSVQVAGKVAQKYIDDLAIEE